MLCDAPRSITAIRGSADRRRVSILDDMVIEALQPLSILQIGVPAQLLDGDCGDVTIRRVRSLDEAVGAIAQHEFDAIVLQSGAVDAWPTAAYEQVAMLAGATPIVVQTDFVGPMTSIKQQQERKQDILVVTPKASLLGRLVLTAILRNRALAEEPGTEIG